MFLLYNLSQSYQFFFPNLTINEFISLSCCVQFILHLFIYITYISSCHSNKQFAIYSWFIFFYSHHFPAWQCINIVRRNKKLVTNSALFLACLILRNSQPPALELTCPFFRLAVKIGTHEGTLSLQQVICSVYKEGTRRRELSLQSKPLWIRWTSCGNKVSIRSWRQDF